MEYSHVLVDVLRFAKHALVVILVKLEVFQLLPVCPILLFQKFASSQPHNPVDNIENIA
jgi:hypothetical protein